MANLPENTPLVPVFLRDALAQKCFQRECASSESVAVLLMSRAVNQLLKGFKNIQTPERQYIAYIEANKISRQVLTPLAVAFLGSVRNYSGIASMRLEKKTFLEKAAVLLPSALPLAFLLQEKVERHKILQDVQKKLMKPEDKKDVFQKIQIFDLSPDQLRNAQHGAYDLACQLFKDKGDFHLESLASRPEDLGPSLHQFFLTTLFNSEISLPSRQLQALLLFYSFDGSPRLGKSEMLQHVADTLGLNLAWVNSLIKEAINNIRQSIRF